MKTYTVILALAGLLANLPIARAEVRFLAHGHTDLAIDYDATTTNWNFHVGSDTIGAEFAPDEVILKVKAAARTNVPPNATFLGAVSSPVWILPIVQNEELLYLGYGGDGIPDGIFVGNQVKVALKSVTGPGNFFSYGADSFGNPIVYFNSADGVSANDVATVQGGGDAHLSWAFTQPGDYTAVLEASGTLVAGNTVTSSGPVAFTFSVGAGPKILDTGHTDLAINYSPDADAWDVNVGSDALGEIYDADDLILQVKGEAKTNVPPSAAFGFLGSAGDPIWILPNVQNESLLYLGYGAEGIPDGIFVGNQVKVALKSVTGLGGVAAPGYFFSYGADSFANPVVYFNTKDGISSNDVATVQSGGDAHISWAFSQPGDYEVTVEVSGTLVSTNTTVTSGPVTYTFSVLKPKTLLTVEHTDVQAVYDASATNKLSILIYDVNHTIAYQSNEVALVVAEAAKTPLPPGTPLGNAGAPLWILPASQDPALLYLGLSAEPPNAAVGRPGVPSGVFNGNLTFRLKAVHGPGQFMLWQNPSPGAFDIQMDSRDGIADIDFHTQIIGSHEHFNWGFTTNGVYQITFQLAGQLAGSTNISSPETSFTFHVLPLPTNAPPPNIQLSDLKFLGGTNLTLNLVGAANLTVEVQATEDFAQWSAVTNFTVTTSPHAVTIPADAAQLHRFFRVQQK
jgi:surface-anchored protein